ncbi:MAG: hmgA [Modestobacter sp.]|nr:hmgA [Modestobacter sp.]
MSRAEGAPASTMDQLAAFTAVAEAGTISAAAERLPVSPSALPAARSGLERALQVELLRRREAKGAASARPPGPLLPVGQGVHREVFAEHCGPGPDGLAGTVHVTPTHPFDVIGWDGCLYPYAFTIADFEPITGRVHRPPPVHQVFEAQNFVICNFVPRKVDHHPLAVPVPCYHSNVDSEEIMFYVDGDYEARKGSGIGRGSIPVHPGGHSHGPQPGAIENCLGAEHFEETAVMVDTFRPLDLGEAGTAVDDRRYAWSWSRSWSSGRRATWNDQAGDR